MDSQPPDNDRQQAHDCQHCRKDENAPTRDRTRRALWFVLMSSILEIWTVLDWPTSVGDLPSRSATNKLVTLAALGIWLAGMFKLWSGGDRSLVASSCACSTVVSYACLLFEVGKRESLVVITVSQLAAATMHLL